jgi:hypothetical protein
VRASRTVLREARGAIPLAYSPFHIDVLRKRSPYMVLPADARIAFMFDLIRVKTASVYPASL